MSFGGMNLGDFKKWLAIGSGVGIEIEGPHGAESLHVAAVRVRPSGARVLGGFTVEDFPHQTASAWGADCNAFLGKLRLRHAAAAVLLPRQDVIVRQLSLPGVTDKDVAAAVQFQLDGLHPYAEEDVAVSWTRLDGRGSVLVAIARRQTIERYATAFAEAGVKISSFTCSAAAIYSARRLLVASPATEILACQERNGTVEFYGESPSRPVFSASFGAVEERAAALAAAELRLPPDTIPCTYAELLGAAPALSYAAALASACSRLSLRLNLLPAEHRYVSSRAPWVSAAALGSLVLLLAGAVTAFPRYEERRYLRSLESQIAAVDPRARHAEDLDREINQARQRIQVLDHVRTHTKADMDLLSELTRILAPPTWVTQLEVSPTQVIVGGETDQAAALLRVIDGSPLFEKSEFTSPPSRSASGELFRIRSEREAGK